MLSLTGSRSSNAWKKGGVWEKIYDALRAEQLAKNFSRDKKLLVFAPTKYLDQEALDRLNIDFAQLPFEICKLAK